MSERPRTYVTERGQVRNFPVFQDMPVLDTAELEHEKHELAEAIAYHMVYLAVYACEGPDGEDYHWWECEECHNTQAKHFPGCSVGKACERLAEICDPKGWKHQPVWDTGHRS